jgi:hypothetical protein
MCYGIIIQEKIMRQCLLIAGCACLLACAAKAAEPSFELHEWGVFGVYPNVKYANADMKAEWESLPKFMYGFVKEKTVPECPTAVWKPIVYIHTKDAFPLSMTVRFPKGMPTVWYPAAANMIGDLKGLIMADRLDWNLQVNQRPQAFLNCFKGTEIETKIETELEAELKTKLETERKLKEAQLTPWVALARKPESAQVFAEVGFDNHGLPVYYDDEKFVYYDGLVPAPQYIKFSTLQKDLDSLRIENSATFEIPAFFILDRSDKDRIRFGSLNNAKGKNFIVPMQEIKPAEWPAEAEKTIAAAMVTAGLNKDEAESAIAIWRKDFFENDGVTLLWLLPQAEYDKLLPLSLNPPAKKLVRVGLVHQPHADGAEARILELIKQLEDSHEEASKALASIGGIALPYLREAAKNSKKGEIVTRCKQILDAIDAESYFKMSPP